MTKKEIKDLKEKALRKQHEVDAKKQELEARQAELNAMLDLLNQFGETL